MKNNTPSTLILRPIEPSDNAGVKALVQNTLEEFGYTGEGIASNDPELEDMAAFYSHPGRQYWVLINEVTQDVLAGGGYSELPGAGNAEAICILQKCHCVPSLRGQGWGTQILERCLISAKNAGYHSMYLETLEGLRRATSLYERHGFHHVNQPFGNTSHKERCTIFMLKDLRA